MCVPVPADGVYVKVHEAELPLPASEHEVVGENVPVPVDVRLPTVPVGVLVPGDESATVAVHVVGEPVITLVGVHVIEVVVGRLTLKVAIAERAGGPPLPSEAVTVAV